MNEREHFSHLAEASAILDELSAEIEELGARLCGDPGIAAAHMTELQAIDLIAQKQRWIADLVRAECPASAVDSINVELLQQRLRASV